LVKNVIESNSVLIRPGVELISDIQLESVPTVLGDSHRVSQILLNFFSNAAKFTSSGSIRFSARINEFIPTPSRDPSDSGNKMVVLEFRCRDTGIGITLETMQGLFKPFKQADSSTTRKFGGTGLGLAITHSLVSAMGGQITLYSTLGSGSEFVWTLKFNCASQSKSPTSLGKEDGLINRVDNLRRRLKVLLVEDNEFNQLIISKILVNLSCDVILANNGLEAVQIASKSSFDIILMDIQMPIMDGYEATKCIRQATKDKTQGIPIVGLTANADQRTRETCISYGMSEVVTKPIQAATLLELLRRFENSGELQ